MSGSNFSIDEFSISIDGVPIEGFVKYPAIVRGQCGLEVPEPPAGAYDAFLKFIKTTPVNNCVNESIFERMTQLYPNRYFIKSNVLDYLQDIEHPLYDEACLLAKRGI
jgi:hypothetical protein